MEQKDNKALMAAATVAKPAADSAITVDPAEYKPENVFTDGLGNRSASYNLNDLLDGDTPYLDVILYATASIVAGADTQSTVQGDVPIALYVDEKKQYDDNLEEYDPTTATSADPNNQNAGTAYDQRWHKKFYNPEKATQMQGNISYYLVKGSDLALETMVENSGGNNKDTGTTYWSLKKSLENSYYDQEIDKDPNDPGSGRTITMMSEVAITGGLKLEGQEDSPQKRTLNVNSYDLQVANNTGKTDGTSAEDITLKNAWLTITDLSNTTGAEMAIGNNAQFVIDQGAKLIIDKTCQLEIEWDGATTTAADAQASQPSILKNGMLDLRAGGELVNNGIISIEGTEGKPYQEGSGQEQQVINSEKGMGEMSIRKGAKLTNNGALVVYGKLNNYGTLVNNGKYNDVIKSNDPDKGAFDYHKGIQVAWKDDVTQKNIVAGMLINSEGATMINNGDIVLTPGTLENNGTLYNETGANIYSAAVSEAIIPITANPATPTIVSKRITLSPVETSRIINNGTLVNNGNIAPATVKLLDNTGGFDKLTSPGEHPELFIFENNGKLINNGSIYGYQKDTGEGQKATLIGALVGSIQTENDIWLYFYRDGTFMILFSDGTKLTGTFQFVDNMLILKLTDGTVLTPVTDANGNYVYSIKTASVDIEIVLNAAFVSRIQRIYNEMNAR